MQNPHLNKIATLLPLKRRRLNVAPLAVTVSPLLKEKLNPQIKK